MEIHKIDELEIPQDTISVFTGGFSVDELDDDDLWYIKRKTCMTAINEYLWNRIDPHIRVWYDNGISDNLARVEKNSVYITRPRGLTYNILGKIDYVFDDLLTEGEYTFYSWIQILRKYYPEKTILMFGFDCYSSDERMCWDKGKLVKRKIINYSKTLKEHKDFFENRYKREPEFFDNIWNCNLSSAVDIPKKDYKELL